MRIYYTIAGEYYLENPHGYLMVSTCFLSDDSHVEGDRIHTGSLSTVELDLDGVPLPDQFVAHGQHDWAEE